jgi:sugar/nucleoside kinase (ribokinase family)
LVVCSTSLLVASHHLADVYPIAKTFEYTTPPLRASPADLIDTPLLHAKAFHFFGSPQEIQVHVPELLRLREAGAITARPFLVWEPLPSSCKPENKEAFEEACKLVNIFSPNHLEISALFSEVHDCGSMEDVEIMGQRLVHAGIGPQGDGAVVIRAGENGAIAMARGKATIRLPAFYEKDSPRVVDVTGGGNTFLGGYVAGWLGSKGDMEEAMCCGHVAASFAIEQIGLPRCEKADGGEVTWNGKGAIQRLDEYKRRLR